MSMQIPSTNAWSVLDGIWPELKVNEVIHLVNIVYVLNLEVKDSVPALMALFGKTHNNQGDIISGGDKCYEEKR